MKHAKKQAEEKQDLTVVKDLKQIPFKVHPTDEKFDTGKLIAILLNYQPQDDPSFRITTTEMRQRFKILDAIDARHKDSMVLELTEEQVKILSDMSPKIPWKISDRFIIEFEDSLK